MEHVVFFKDLSLDFTISLQISDVVKASNFNTVLYAYVINLCTSEKNTKFDNNSLIMSSKKFIAGFVVTDYQLFQT